MEDRTLLEEQIVEPHGLPEYFADGFGNFRNSNGIFRFVPFTEQETPGGRITRVAFMRFYVTLTGAQNATARATTFLDVAPHGLVMSGTGTRN